MISLLWSVSMVPTLRVIFVHFFLLWLPLLLSVLCYPFPQTKCAHRCSAVSVQIVSSGFRWFQVCAACISAFLVNLSTFSCFIHGKTLHNAITIDLLDEGGLTSLDSFRLCPLSSISYVSAEAPTSPKIKGKGNLSFGVSATMFLLTGSPQRRF